MSGISGSSIYSKIDKDKEYKEYKLLPGESLDFFTRRVFEDVTGLEYNIDVKRYKVRKLENEEMGFVWIWSRKR